jgi:hypothetical protein
MDKTVSTFAKNKFQEIRVGVKEFRGNDLIDVRVWTQTQFSEEKVPTSKGVSFNVSLFLNFKDAVVKLEEALKENRML